MLSSTIKFKLTRRRKLQLIQLGAHIIPGDISIIDLTESPDGVRSFLDELISKGDVEIDPIIQPTFGIIGAVTQQVQQEVYNIISSYQNLLADDFAGGVSPPIFLAGAIPRAQMWQFHHAQMAIVGLIERLADPGPGPYTNTIHNIPPASFICELSIIYSDVVFIIRIMRAV
jgi:hypothetical protein